MDAGNALWDKIDAFQAEDAVQKVASGAIHLEESKQKLQSDLKEGQIKNADELKQRVTAIRHELESYQDLLEKFSYEINAASHNLAIEIDATAGSLITGKDERLDEVVHIWRVDSQASQKQAVQQLDVAMVCSQEIATAASCLSNSIQDKKRDPRSECSKDAMEKSKETCTADH